MNSLIAVCVGVSLASIAGSAKALTLVYDAYVTPNTLPQNTPSSPWSVGVGSAGIATASGTTLTINDNSTSSTGPWWKTNGLSAADVSSTIDYEIRARLSISSYTNNGGALQLGFHATVEDGSRFTGFGLLFTNGQTEVALQGSSTQPIGTPIFVNGSPVLNILLTKVGGASGTLTLKVYDDANNLLGTNAFAYSSAGGGDGTRTVYWGAPTGDETSFSTLTGISFGLGNGVAAPDLIPEPSIIGLSMAGLFLMVRGIRKI